MNGWEQLVAIIVGCIAFTIVGVSLADALEKRSRR
jgi:hypothetical protein